jgi:hypothetical protein
VRVFAAALLGWLFLAPAAQAQRIPDIGADIAVAHPAFAPGRGPRLAIDGGHDNFHTLHGRFAPFAALMARDGFRVSALDRPFDAGVLRHVDVLVIANALNPANRDRWALPTPPAFTPAEVAAVARWVRGGGALLLIADHLPFAGAAETLAEAFGFHFVNGFALHEPPRTSDLFRLEDGSLADDAIRRGRNAAERVTAVATFTGSAFRAPPAARPLLRLPKNFQLWMPKVAWDFSPRTPRRSGAGYLQGAAMEFGRGRIAVFGEGGMFTAQHDTQAPPYDVGFNAPEARQNKQYILNVLHWLAGSLPPG